MQIRHSKSSWSWTGEKSARCSRWRRYSASERLSADARSGVFRWMVFRNRFIHSSGFARFCSRRTALGRGFASRTNPTWEWNSSGTRLSITPIQKGFPFCFIGYSRTRSTVGSAWIRKGFPQEPWRTLASVGEEESRVGYLCHSSRIKGSAKDHLCLLMAGSLSLRANPGRVSRIIYGRSRETRRERERERERESKQEEALVKKSRETRRGSAWSAKRTRIRRGGRWRDTRVIRELVRSQERPIKTRRGFLRRERDIYTHIWGRGLEKK